MPVCRSCLTEHALGDARCPGATAPTRVDTALGRAETTFDSAVARAVTNVDSAAVRAATNVNSPAVSSETLAVAPAARTATVARQPTQGQEVRGADPDEIPPGTQIYNWTITAKLGEGGMGAVYAATTAEIGLTVAVKVLSFPGWRNPQMQKDFEDAKERFRREAEAASRLKHPNVIAILAYGSLPDGRPYFVMEYLPGHSLDARLRENPPRGKELLRLLSQVCDALASIHLEGIVHRDLKPENIWIVEPKQGDSFAKLLDFGISKMAGARTLTATGTHPATLYYASPEQLGGGVLDHRSDVYSFGAVLYEVFTGRVPFGGGTIERTLTDTLFSAPPPMVARDVYTVSPELERLVLDCLHKKPEGRPQSALELKDRLQSALAPEASTTVPRETPRRPVGRRLSQPAQTSDDPLATANIVATMTGSRRLFMQIMVAVFALALALGAYLGMRRWAESRSPVAVPTKAVESPNLAPAPTAPTAPAEIPVPTLAKDRIAPQEVAKPNAAVRDLPSTRHRSASRGSARVQPSANEPRSPGAEATLAPPPPPASTTPSPAAAAPPSAPWPPTEAAPTVRAAHQPALPQKPELIYKDLRTEK
jgi:serine/threonine protein kinase